MKFYSGFSMINDEPFFNDFIDESVYAIGGFSYGAIKAIQDAFQRVQEKKRVDRVQLFSPAFFQTKPDKFKRLQLMGFAKNKESYLDSFIELCFAPYQRVLTSHYHPQIDELQELLYYEWSADMMRFIQLQGVVIEVYLGGRDAIIDVEGARSFFADFADVTYIKEGNHFLRIE